MIGVLAVAALITGMNIPDSPEQGRLNFYHWAFALSFFELLVFGWLLARLAPVVTPKLRHGRPVTAVAVAAVVIAGVAVTPLVVDRASDRLLQPLPAASVRELLADLEGSEALDSVDGPLLVLVHGDDRYVQVGDTIGTRLAIDGMPITFPPSSKGFVHPDRLADLCAVQQALVIGLIRTGVEPPEGTELSRVDAAPTLDREALARLQDQVEGPEVVFGDDLTAALAALPGDQGDLIGATLMFRLPDRSGEVLLSRFNLDLLIDHPIEKPAFDRADLVALRDSLPEGSNVVATDLTASLLDREQLAAYRPDLFEGC
jgi:hypothetical protein